MDEKAKETLYQILTTAFCVIVVVSNMVSAKMVNLPFYGEIGIPAGVMIYPITFFISDYITEIFSAWKAKLMVYKAFGMTFLSLIIIQIALALPTDDIESNTAFRSVLGSSSLVIFASLSAYVVAQILDIHVYARIKNLTGEKWLWMRNNGSTLLSQVVDTLMVNTIHLYWGLGMDVKSVAQIMIFVYFYKAAFSIINTPLFYLAVNLTRYKGILWKSNVS